MDLVRKYALPASAVMGVLIIVLALTRWQPVSEIRRHQDAFFQAVEDRKARRIDDLVASDYADPWGFDRNKLILACDDFRRFFLLLDLEPLDPKIEAKGGTGTFTARIRVQGSPVGPGTLIRSEANALQTPFVFTWRRSGFFPWQWKLERMENAGLTELHGYEPGATLEMLDVP